jgi:hypothetical protein
MSKAVLAAAKELIGEGKYHEAVTILRALPDDPTAKKWLATLEAKYLPKAPTGPTSIGLTAKEMRAYEAKRLREAQAGKRPRQSASQSGCVLLVLIVIGVFVWTNANQPGSSTQRRTEPTPASAEGQIEAMVNEIVIGDVSRVLINPNQGAPVVVIEWAAAQGFDGPQIDLTGYQMVQVACGLYGMNYAEGWRYQLSAMVELVNTSNGQTFTDDGITARVDGADVAGWDCSNAINIRIDNAATEYFVNPVLTR